MLQIEYKIKLGQDEFTIRAEVLDEKDFFQKMSFYSNLPKLGPNGENDLKITHRTTTQGYNYYSLVSEKAGQEYKFGQVNEKDGGLYPKGWEPIYKGNDQNQQQTTQAPLVGAPQMQAPVQTYQQPQVPTVNVPGMPAPYVGPSAASPVPQTVTAPVQTYQPPVTTGYVPPTIQAPVAQQAPAQAPATNPQVAIAANNVLQRFGINPTK